jgi:hypothetical protein
VHRIGWLQTPTSRVRRNYPAYAFTNRSEDILRLFIWACTLLSLRPRRTNRVTISLARRADVATLDSLFGNRDDHEIVARALDASLVITP